MWEKIISPKHFTVCYLDYSCQESPDLIKYYHLIAVMDVMEWLPSMQCWANPLMDAFLSKDENSLCSSGACVFIKEYKIDLENPFLGLCQVTLQAGR